MPTVCPRGGLSNETSLAAALRHLFSDSDEEADETEEKNSGKRKLDTDKVAESNITLGKIAGNGAGMGNESESSLVGQSIYPILGVNLEVIATVLKLCFSVTTMYVQVSIKSPELLQLHFLKNRRPKNSGVLDSTKLQETLLFDHKARFIKTLEI